MRECVVHEEIMETNKSEGYKRFNQGDADFER